MKYIYKKRNQIEQEAIEFLKNGLFAEHPDDCPNTVHFAITAQYKAQRPNEYEEEVRCFKALFHTEKNATEWLFGICSFIMRP